VPGKPEWFADALFNRSTFNMAASECGIGASPTNLGRHEIRRCAFNCSKVHDAASKRRNGASLTGRPLEPTPYSNVSGDTFPINPRPSPIRQLELLLRHAPCDGRL
jgi:hypothetical protein